MFLLESKLEESVLGLLYLNPSTYYLLKKDFITEEYEDSVILQRFLNEQY